MVKNRAAALVAAISLLAALVSAAGTASAVTYNEIRQQGCTSLPAQTNPSCSDLAALVACQVSRADNAPVDASGPLSCGSAADLAAQAAGLLRATCGQLTADHRAALGRVRDLETQLAACHTPQPQPSPTPRTVRLPLCDERSGARMICRVGNVVYRGAQNCARVRQRITYAGCACPTVDGYNLASASRRFSNLNGVRAGFGDFCVPLVRGEERAPVGIDPERFNQALVQLSEHESRLNALCANEDDCRELRARIDSLRATLTATGAYDDTALRADLTALTQRVNGIRSDVDQNIAVLQRVCNTTERPSVDNCRPATSNVDRASDPQRVFITPSIGGFGGLLAGAKLGFGSVGVEAMVMFNPSWGLAVGGQLLAGRFGANGVDNAMAGGYAFTAQVRHRFLIGTRFAALGFGYERADFGSMGASEVNSAAEIARFGDYLGHANAGVVSFSMRLFGPVGILADFAAGAGTAVIGDGAGRFGTVNDELYIRGGARIVINN